MSTPMPPPASSGDRGRPRVRAVVTIDAPALLERGDSAELGGSIVQPSGVSNGTRVVPLRYPMSVHWSGSDSLAIGTDVDAARAAGKVAILDPATRRLTGLRTAMSRSA